MTSPPETPRNSRVMRLLPWLGLLVFACVMSLRIQPAWNLDAVFYAGSSYVQTGDSPTRAHQRVYAEIGETAPPEMARALTSSSGYRKRVAASAEAFSGQLPFYTSKPLYVSATTAVRVVTGQGGLASTFLVSRIAFVLMLLGLAAAARSFASPVVAAGLGVVFGLGVPAVETSALATPDALCTALVLGAFAGFSRGRLWIGAVLGTLAVLTRPDAVIFVIIGALLPALLFRPRSEWKVGAALGVVVSAVALLPALTGGGYGWSMVMRQTFFGATTHLERLRVPLTGPDYLTALRKGIGGHMSLQHGGFWPYLAASVGGALVGRVVNAPRDRLRRASAAAGLCWVAAGVHVLAFPLVADRMLLPAYAMSLLVPAAALAAWPPLERGTA